jgi:hypothetical protein
MQMYNYTDFTQNMPKVFDTALYDDVIISDSVGNNYRLVPVVETKKGKSPFDGIKKVKVNMTTQDIVQLLHESRAGV